MDKVKVNGSGASPVFQFLKVRWMLAGWLQFGSGLLGDQRLLLARRLQPPRAVHPHSRTGRLFSCCFSRPPPAHNLLLPRTCRWPLATLAQSDGTLVRHEGRLCGSMVPCVLGTAAESWAAVLLATLPARWLHALPMHRSQWHLLTCPHQRTHATPCIHCSQVPGPQGWHRVRPVGAAKNTSNGCCRHAPRAVADVCC